MKYKNITQYKYELASKEIISTPITGYKVDFKLFTLQTNGLLTIHEIYKWDGPSGPMMDTPSAMISSLPHDVFYSMIRLELIPLALRDKIDEFFKDRMITCYKGKYPWFNKFRANYAYYFLLKFGFKSCIPGDIHLPEVQTLECK